MLFGGSGVGPIARWEESVGKKSLIAYIVRSEKVGQAVEDEEVSSAALALSIDDSKSYLLQPRDEEIIFC